jgi:hypothetical protein
MTKRTTITIPTIDGLETREGEVAVFTVGTRRIRVLIHDTTLTDIRSGQRILDFTGVKVRFMARLSQYHRITDREAARIALDEMVERIGAERFLTVVDRAPAVN